MNHVNLVSLGFLLLWLCSTSVALEFKRRDASSSSLTWHRKLLPSFTRAWAPPPQGLAAAGAQHHPPEAHHTVVKASSPAAKASPWASSINLMKNCVGAGVLSLNGRVNTIAPTLASYPQVFALLLLITLWAIHNFYIVGETVRLTGAQTFAETWRTAVEDLPAHGQRPSPSPSEPGQAPRPWRTLPTSYVTFVVTCAPIVSCVANTIVLTDVLTMLLRVVRAPAALVRHRAAVVALLSTVVLLPVCSVESLNGLKSISVIGLSGHLAAVAVIAKRVIDGSYRPGGLFHATAQWATTTTASAAGATTAAAWSKWFIFASLLSYCQVAHYNAPRYYNELDKGPSSATATTATGTAAETAATAAPSPSPSCVFLTMVARAYLGAASLYGLTILATYGLFQNRGQSFALNTLSPLDPLAIGAFVAFGASVLASYPLVFLNVRNWLRQQLLQQQHARVNDGSAAAVPPPAAWLSVRTVAALLLSVIGLVATFVTDIGQLGSVAGAVFGSSMMFVFPPLMYMGALQQPRLVAGEGWTPAEIQRRLRWNRVLLGAGLVLGAVGTFNSVKALFTK